MTFWILSAFLVGIAALSYDQIKKRREKKRNKYRPCPCKWCAVDIRLTDPPFPYKEDFVPGLKEIKFTPNEAVELTGGHYKIHGHDITLPAGKKYMAFISGGPIRADAFSIWKVE